MRSLLSLATLTVALVSATTHHYTSSFFQDLDKNTNLDKYLEEMMFCYDLDSDGMFNSTESKNMFKGQLGQDNCQSNVTLMKSESKLITKVQDVQNLKKWMGIDDKYNIRFELKYRASRDGCDQLQFFNKLDGEAGTITVLTSAMGQVFGGYLSIPLTKVPEQTGFRTDPNAFIFSLTRQEKYPVIEPARAFYQNAENTNIFLAFGKDDLIVTNGCRAQTYYFGEDYRLPNGMEYDAFEFESTTYLHGEKTWEFALTEIETFKVIAY